MLHLINLDPVVRCKMLSEIESDARSGGAYVSPRLTAVGLRDYPQLLRDAATSHNDMWLAAQLNTSGRLKETEERKTKGGITSVKVPHTAAETLAEGDFNRYYIRAVCLTVLDSDVDGEVEVYRAKAVTQPRPESEAWIGRRIKAAKLLADLLAHKHDLATALGVPGGPNSGLSVRIPASK